LDYILLDFGVWNTNKNASGDVKQNSTTPCEKAMNGATIYEYFKGYWKN
jgi:hypothetical protein